MFRRKWNEPIDKHTDWDGDSSTTYLPVSGARVQDFIKETLEGKAGVFYYDSTNNRYLIFADVENQNLYLSNPTAYSSLVLGTFGSSMQSSATITLVDTQTFNYIDISQKGVYIKANFETRDMNGQVTGEPVTVTLAIRAGNNQVEVTRQAAHGTLFSFKMDDYLHEGTNSVTMTITGLDTLATASKTIMFYVQHIEITDVFAFNSPIDIASGTLDITYTIRSGDSKPKQVEWYLDGQQVGVSDTVNGNNVSPTKNLSLSGLTTGKHNLQYRAYVNTDDGQRFYSDTLYRDFVIKEGNSARTTEILVAFNSPSSAGIISTSGQSIPLYGMEMYKAKPIKYAISGAAAENDVTISFDGRETSYVAASDTAYEVELKPYHSGTLPLVITCGNLSVTFSSTVTETTLDLQQIADTEFEFDGTAKTNSSSDKNTYTNNGHTMTLSGFAWNESSGWIGDGLLINNGATASVNYAPLVSSATTRGLTIEIEFEARRVLDDNATICDLRSNSTGLLITASTASLTSRGNASVSTKYKSGELTRVSFIVNRQTGVTNKGLVFICVNGILSGAVPYAQSDSFQSYTTLAFSGSANASILLKQIRIYNRALTLREIENNYILYRPTIESMLEAYDKNDIFEPNSESLSLDKLSAQTPVIIVTGDLEALQNASDKNMEVLMDKIEVINMDDPTRNMTLTKAIMRPQGTSSMEYPKKNFRIYSQRGADTKMYDANGTEVASRLYSFKEGAQPVKTWCLKADYAESSSTHNTGVARLWNYVFKNFQLNSLDSKYYRQNTTFPGRTLAQQAALDNNYQYDVRTTVDGFPIALFYHRHENDPLIFVGKYNWNNDKSTPSVFGFEGIQGFNNEHMECWEVLDSGLDISMFKTVEDWDTLTKNKQDQTVKTWQLSFEARYPDDAGKASEVTRGDNALKTVVSWVASTNGATTVSNGQVVVSNQSKMSEFVTNKWNHFDVYKIAAYYIYLMRFGAVDQVAKNAMFTTEDGVHWFYINYDNDTIFGLRNDGLLVFDYKIDRQSIDPTNPNAYVYAAHDSVLWNNLEADTEFMEIVKLVDGALYRTGLTYRNVIEMFNDEQSSKWSERLHNFDYQFKYLDPWNYDSNNQLEKLQGARTTHREWWISHRFAMYDAINFCGGYVDNYISLKTDSSDATLQKVRITPSSTGQIFGYGAAQRAAFETGVVGTAGTEIEFTTPSSYHLQIGSPLQYYNAVYISKFDASRMSQHINEANFDKINSDAEDSTLEWVVLGNSNQTNTICTNLGTISYAKYLKKLDVRNLVALNTLNLSNNIYFEELDARGCTSLTAVELPDGAPITLLQFPNALQTLVLKNLTSLTSANLTIESFNSTNHLSTIDVQGCPQLSICTSFEFMRKWKSGRGANEAVSGITIDNVNWTFADKTELLDFVHYVQDNGGTLNLKGRATLQSIDEDDINAVFAVFGPDAFKASSAFRIVADGIFLAGPEEVLSGHSATYSLLNPMGIEGTLVYQLVTGATGVSLDRNTGLLTTTENTSANATITIRGTLISGTDVYQRTKNVVVKRVVYPANATISGAQRITGVTEYTWSTTTSGVNGEYYVEWALSGDILSYVTGAASVDNSTYTITPNENTVTAFSDGTLTVTLKKSSNNTTLATASKTIVIQDDNIAFTAATNPGLMSVMYGAGFAQNSSYMLKAECAVLLASDFSVSGVNGSIFTQNSTFSSSSEDMSVFQFFIGVTYIPEYCFYNCRFRNIVLSASITEIKYRGLWVYSGLTSIQHIGNGSLTIRDNGLYIACNSSTFQIDFPIEFDQTTTHGSSSTNFEKLRMYGANSGTDIYFNGEISAVSGAQRCIYASYNISNAYIRSISNFYGSIGSYKSLEFSGNVYIDSITSSSGLFSQGHIYLGENIHEIGNWFTTQYYSGTCTCLGSISTISQQTSLKHYKLELLNNNTLPTTIDLTEDRVDDGGIIVKHSMLGSYRAAWPDLYYKFDDGFVPQGDSVDWRVKADDCRKNNTTTKVHIEKKYNGTYADGTTGQEWLEDSIVTSSSFEANNTNAPITRTLSYTLNGVTKSYSFTQSNNEYIAIDLGLPSGIKWADVNIGASEPEGTGLFFAWGETTGYEDAAARNEALERTDGFDAPNYSGRDIRESLSSSNDGAYAATNGEWRMPTRTEFQELIDNTYKIIINGASGNNNGIIKLISKSDMTKSITLSLPRVFDGNSQISTKGLWSSTYYNYSYISIDGIRYYYPQPYTLRMPSDNLDISYFRGSLGVNIRAVQ